MALETHIHKEITQYKARIIGDFSGRQLLALAGVAGTIGLSYVICVVGLKMSMDTYPYVAMILCAPSLLLGFKQKGSLTFEKYIQLLYRHYFGNNKLSWTAEDAYCEITVPEDNPAPRKKGKTNNVKRKGNPAAPEEAEGYRFGGKKEITAARKRVQAEIKKAKRRHYRKIKASAAAEPNRTKKRNRRN